MSHYLKLVMDAIFGRRSFAVRSYGDPTRGAKRLANNADRLLLYGTVKFYVEPTARVTNTNTSRNSTATMQDWKAL